MTEINIKIEIVHEEKLNEVLNFQKDIIDNMNRKDFFCPLTKEEFLTPIRNLDNVYFLKYNNEIIGLFVATCNIPDVLKEYQLSNNNVMLIDSIMIKEEYRGKEVYKDVVEDEAKLRELKSNLNEVDLGKIFIVKDAPNTILP